MPDQPAGRVHPGLRHFTNDPRLALRPPPAHIPLAKVRAAVNQFLAAGLGPELFDVQDFPVGADGRLTIRVYRPSADILPVIAFIHGGAFIFGGLDSHDALCRRLSSLTGCAVAAIDYRLAPEAPFPEPLDDCLAAMLWLRDHGGELSLDPDRLALAGDSAGGQLAIATTLLLSSRSIALRHLALIYPLIDPGCNSTSCDAFGDGYMLTREFLIWCWRLYGANPEANDNPLFNLSKADLSHLPPTTVITAEFDPLRDEGEAFGRHLATIGIDVQLRRYQGMIHGFVGFPTLTEVAVDAISDMSASLARAMGVSDRK